MEDEASAAETAEKSGHRVGGIGRRKKRLIVPLEVKASARAGHGGDDVKHRRRRKLRLESNRRAVPVKGRVEKIDLRQYKNQKDDDKKAAQNENR
jgi:hypothetical protein